MVEPTSRPVLLYDGECRLCRFTARLVARLDRYEEIALVSLQDDDAVEILGDLPARERFATWHLVSPDAAHAGYGQGVTDLLRAMRSTRHAGRVLGVVPSGILDRAYRGIARTRGRLGRLVPDGPAPRRYP